MDHTALFKGIYKGKRVLLTGHTGFKGSWLEMWLQAMGAEVMGYSLAPNTEPSHYNLLGLNGGSVLGDIRDRKLLSRTIVDFRPDAVFHLAAQALVRESYNSPIDTLEANIMGTANLLDACRNVPSLKAIVVVTSDKCYENREWFWGYRENDPMGGYDPYSASKGCAELVTASYRNSFFNPDKYGSGHHVLVASARAGNVIGGGDWAADRLVPDIMRAVSRDEEVVIRNPRATRPWQHVLEPLCGYLMLGQALLEGRKDFSGAWNFGPSDDNAIPVIQVVENVKKFWDRISYTVDPAGATLHEAGYLKLDSSKALTKLKWKSLWASDVTFEKTVRWYRDFYEGSRVITVEQLHEYISSAVESKSSWAI